MGQTLFPTGPGAGPRRVSLVRLSAEIARAAADVGRVAVEGARCPGYPVRCGGVPVSGPGAARARAEAVVRLDRRPEVEVIVLARGGGDPAQLLPFSDEELCRAIASSSTPVVTAIGHEGDRPLCDEVADLRCATPSLAAAAIVPSRLELERLLEGLLGLVSAAAVDRLDAHTRRLGTLDGAVAPGAPLGSAQARPGGGSGEHTSELQSQSK